jgi:hypothetical protein
MKAEWVNDKIIFVQFKTVDDMARTAIRIGEYYEQRNKIFKYHRPTFRQFMKWYKENMDVKPYRSYYQGLTVPGIYISNFVRDYKKKEYSAKEKQFLDCMSTLLGRQQLKRSLKYAVILCSEGARSSVYRHEMAHCFLYLYKKEFLKIVNRLIKKIDKSEYNKMTGFLIKYGYSEDELDEEIYCRLIEKMAISKLFKNVNIRIPNRLRKQFKDSYDAHYSKIYT